MNRLIRILIMQMGTLAVLGCNGFLDERTDKKLALPNTLPDLQALLDNHGIINGVDVGNGQVASDDYYMLEQSWSTLSEQDRRAYFWSTENSASHNPWMATYRIIYYSNVVLEALDRMVALKGIDRETWNNVAGQAYFLRAKSHLAAVSIWASAYDENSASTDLGIPIRLNSDINRASARATNHETYMQIIADLEAAVGLLPDLAQHTLRPGKAAAYALLARTYLFMRDYEKCLFHAENSLAIHSELLDYNALDSSTTYPIARFNDETLYACWIGFNPVLQESRLLVDSTLYKLYGQGDLRKTLFFRLNKSGGVGYRGSYTGSSLLFSGVAVDEVYLMAAECYVRLGAPDEGAARLNELLKMRFKTESFEPIAIDETGRLLEAVLTERRKELLLRGLRFPDVKRLNKEDPSIGFRRFLEESKEEYFLPPNDLRFALPIPEEVLSRAPGLKQNPY